MSNLHGCLVVGPDGAQYRLVLNDELPVRTPETEERLASIFNPSEPIGPQIRAAREALGLSLRKFARVADISYVALCRNETGETLPSRMMLKAIESAIKKQSSVISG